MAEPIIDWLLVLTNLSSGAWTMKQAVDYTGMPAAAIEAHIRVARFGGKPWTPRHADLAGRVVRRLGTRAGVTLLSWPAALALIAVLAAISGGAYMYVNWGKPSSEPVAPGPAMNRGTAQQAPPADAPTGNSPVPMPVDGNPQQLTPEQKDRYGEDLAQALGNQAPSPSASSEAPKAFFYLVEDEADREAPRQPSSRAKGSSKADDDDDDSDERDERPRRAARHDNEDSERDDDDEKEERSHSRSDDGGDDEGESCDDEDDE
jgi:hypothetical protein